MNIIKFTRHGLIYHYLSDTSVDLTGEYVRREEADALAAERDALQAKVDALILFVNGKLTRAEMDSRLEGLVLK